MCTVRNLCKSACVPLLVLGGGGYNPANVARAQTYFTSILIDQVALFDRTVYFLAKRLTWAGAEQ